MDVRRDSLNFNSIGNELARAIHLSPKILIVQRMIGWWLRARSRTTGRRAVKREEGWSEGSHVCEAQPLKRDARP